MATTTTQMVKPITDVTSASDASTITKHESETVTYNSTRIVSVPNGATPLTTAPTPILSPSSPAPPHGIRPRAIAAIVPVVVVALVLCVGGAWICRRRRVKRAETSSWRTSALLGTSSRRSNYHMSLDRRNR